MDMQWLAAEAKQIHALFSGLFYSVVLTLILLGVVLNYFKFPLGGTPAFSELVGRALIAAFLLAALPEIMNTLSDLTDNLAHEIGALHNFKLVVHRLGEKIGDLTWSWVSFKDSVLLLISYLTFFIVYITVYFADSLFLISWTLLYVFSPLLIAAFTLPATAKATMGLFRSMIEVCLWKITWSVLAALLWSFALSEVNKPEYNVDFLTAILINVMLAFSVLVTPMIVKALVSGGLHSTLASTGGAILAATALTPGQLTNLGKASLTKGASLIGKKGEEKEEKEREV